MVTIIIYLPVIGMEKRRSFLNLIDVCIELDENADVTGNCQAIFRKILTDYFFGDETSDSRKMDLLFKDLELPDFLSESTSLIHADMGKLVAFIGGESIKTSLAGKVYLSTEYLKSFYQNHVPNFNKMPPDIQEEILQKIKAKNAQILDSFEKMKTDREADRSRKVLTLVALILKNIQLKSGIPMSRLAQPAETIIRSIFSSCDEVFRAQQKQLVELNDDKKIKDLAKAFFVVKTYQEISEIASAFKNELLRYKKRALRA